LERTITIDSAKDTYYGTVFTGIAIFVTALVIFVGVNVIIARSDTRKQVKAIADEARTSLANQEAAFKKIFTSMNWTFHYS
jgi:hypothetical protein